MAADGSGVAQKDFSCSDSPSTAPVCRWRPSSAQEQQAMRAAGPTQIHALLPAGADPGIEATNHGQDRRPRLGGSLQRQPPHGGLTDHRRDPDQSWAGAKPHAPHGLAGDLPETPLHGAWRAIGAHSLPRGCQHGHDCGSGLGHQN